MKEGLSLLEARNLRVIRGGALLLDVPSLKIQGGESLALIGPNGAGKTTLMHALSYLLQPFEGEVWFKREKVQSRDSILAYRRKLAMVFQEPLLFDTTVFKNIASGLKIRGMKQSAIDEIVGQQLEIFGIGHLRDRSARTLSGGEAQRTTLARALAVSPEIMFLDEPFSALDPPTRESLIEDLGKILRDTHTTTIFATHDRLEALRLSDRLAVMNKGKLHQIGSPTEVMNRPADEFVASFVGVETILTGKVVQKNGGSFIVAINGQKIEAVGEVEAGESVVFCIRPENVTLTIPPRKESSSARNFFPGKIERIIPLGLFYKIQLDCGFPLISYITSHSLENLSLQEGQEVVASFKATSIHVVRKKSE
jgi:tungstate transport system ATP-binding protein